MFGFYRDEDGEGGWEGFLMVANDTNKYSRITEGKDFSMV